MVLNNCTKFEKKSLNPFSSYCLETIRGRTDRRTLDCRIFRRVSHNTSRHSVVGYKNQL